MLVDTVSVVFSGGHGGAGIVSFGKKERSGPDGGNGGAGGNLYVKAVPDITLLREFKERPNLEAGRGNPGRKNRQSGKAGTDLTILLPRGTFIYDEETNNLLHELKDVDETILVAEGGLGGRGNYEFRSPRRTTPEFAQQGRRGEIKHLKLVLKLIADFGLIGLPNAGKSSLLNELTNANAKVGSYAFTTISPNLGSFNGKTIADIPGLIEGASDNKGLGISFLKHIEKVKVIIHCLSADTKSPLKDYEVVRDEMGKYNKELLEKPEIIVITKSDLVDKKTLTKLVKQFSQKASKVLSVSIHDWDSLENLKQILKS